MLEWRANLRCILHTRSPGHIACASCIAGVIVLGKVSAALAALLEADWVAASDAANSNIAEHYALNLIALAKVWHVSTSLRQLGVDKPVFVPAQPKP